MQQIMANDPINELCRALAQLSLPENPVAAEAQAVNRNNLTTLQNKLAQALQRLVKAHRRSSQAPHGATEPTTVDSSTAGMLTLS